MFVEASCDSVGGVGGGYGPGVATEALQYGAVGKLLKFIFIKMFLSIYHDSVDNIMWVVHVKWSFQSFFFHGNQEVACIFCPR